MFSSFDVISFSPFLLVPLPELRSHWFGTKGEEWCSNQIKPAPDWMGSWRKAAFLWIQAFRLQFCCCSCCCRHVSLRSKSLASLELQCWKALKKKKKKIVVLLLLFSSSNLIYSIIALFLSSSFLFCLLILMNLWREKKCDCFCFCFFVHLFLLFSCFFFFFLFFSSSCTSFELILFILFPVYICFVWVLLRPPNPHIHSFFFLRLQSCYLSSWNFSTGTLFLVLLVLCDIIFQ